METSHEPFSTSDGWRHQDGPPRIVSLPAVCGGDACVTGTRIPVWVLEQARRRGRSAQQILESHPALTGEDLAAAWSYALSHPKEIDEQIRENLED